MTSGGAMRGDSATPYLFGFCTLWSKRKAPSPPFCGVPASPSQLWKLRMPPRFRAPIKNLFDKMVSEYPSLVFFPGFLKRHSFAVGVLERQWYSSRNRSANLGDMPCPKAGGYFQV